MALEGDGTSIARARHLAAGFLTRVQAEYGLPASQRAMDLTQLVVSELVTNARKYAPGPVLMDLRIVGDAVEVVVGDCDPVLPVARAADAGRVGQHGLEIVMAVAQGFAAQREPVGKRITARIALLDDPGGAIAARRPL
ncbi:ATP-binding protein [Streptomyces variegatus]|uniref:ATP-binding protein n=1 Tax=Streptomyces variegatus TaxID=284040 RepID=UPI003C2D1193